MTFRVHFTIDGFDDYIDIEGDDIEEIREKAKIEEEKRGLDIDKNNLWSEEL